MIHVGYLLVSHVMFNLIGWLDTCLGESDCAPCSCTCTRIR